MLAEAAALAQEAGDTAVLGHAALLFGLGHEHGTAYDPEVVALLERALAEVGEDNPALRARLLARLAWQQLQPEQVGERGRLSAEAVREARRSGDPGALAAALNARCWGLAHPDQFAERTSVAGEAVMAARDAHDVDLEFGALTWRFRCALDGGRIDAARTAAAEFDDLARRFPLPYHRWFAPLFLAVIALVEGRLDDADALAAEVDPASTGQEAMAIVNRAGLLGDIGVARGGAAATAGVATMLDAIDATMGIGWVMRPHLLALQGRVDAARHALDDSMAIFAAHPADEDSLMILSSLAAGAVLTGSKPHARTLFDRLEPYAERWISVNGVNCRGPVSSFLSILAETLEMPDVAERHREAARRGIADNRAPGVAFWLELRPLATPTTVRPGGLSAREAEVVALLARGHSNQEIADALVLSVRTVQRHIENAYGRLGVHNRAGATLEAVRLGLVAANDVRDVTG